MAADSLGPPCTPSRTVSSEPCLVRRDSMEDADSSVKRKRPRLDSGDRAYRSMSADKAIASPGGDEHADSQPVHAHSRSVEPELLRTPSPTSKPLPSLNRTPSRVTINVRTPVRPDATAEGGRPQEQDGAQHAADDVNHNGAERAGEPPGDATKVISISSSPARSPEIEVAEVEDMDQDPNETRWTSVVNIMGDSGTVDALLLTFPLSDRYPTLRDTVLYIGQIFEKGT